MASASRLPSRIPFQQMTVEYVVLGELDGSTPAPTVSTDPDDEDYVEPDERGIRVVEVPGNLGIIDPDFNGGGAQGDRCVPWVYLDTDGVAGDLTSQFAVLDVTLDDDFPSPIPQFPNRFSTGGSDLFYSQKATHVPQGSGLAVWGYPAGSPKIVRVNVVAPNDPLEEAKMKEACCCANAPCLVEPALFDASPTELELIPSEIKLTGENLLIPSGPTDPTDVFATGVYPAQYKLVQTEGGNAIIEAELVDVNPGGTSATILVTPDPENTPPGTYAILAFDPLNPDCNNGDDPGIPTVDFVPVDCADVTAVDGDVSVAAGSTDNQLNVTGTALGSSVFTKIAAFIGNGVDNLTVTSIDVSPDGTSATIFYDADGPAGSYNLQISKFGGPNQECGFNLFPNFITVNP